MAPQAGVVGIGPTAGRRVFWKVEVLENSTVVMFTLHIY